MTGDVAVLGHAGLSRKLARGRPVSVVGLTIAVIGSLCATIRSADAADFFAGKTITLSTYANPGDSYDLYLRLLSRHYGQHIPGNPNFVVINQPGAGGLLALNHAGLVAPQDGTFLTLASQGLLIYEATGQPGVRVSQGSFKWLGAFAQSNNITVTWYTSKIKTIQDAIANETVVGASGTGGASAVGPALYNAALGTKFKVVYGYPGGADIDLAMQRGEIDGRGNNNWAGLKAFSQNLLRDGKLNILIQTGLRKDPELPNVPLFLDLAKGDAAREPIANFMSYAVAATWSLAAPPGVPDARVELLRRAFDATMKDPDFLADAANLKADINPLTGEQLQDIVRQVLATPKPIKGQIETALGLPVN